MAADAGDMAARGALANLVLLVTPWRQWRHGVSKVSPFGFMQARADSALCGGGWPVHRPCRSAGHDLRRETSLEGRRERARQA